MGIISWCSYLFLQVLSPISQASATICSRWREVNLEDFSWYRSVVHCKERNKTHIEISWDLGRNIKEVKNSDSLLWIYRVMVNEKNRKGKNGVNLQILHKHILRVRQDQRTFHWDFTRNINELHWKLLIAFHSPLIWNKVYPIFLKPWISTLHFCVYRAQKAESFCCKILQFFRFTEKCLQHIARQHQLTN